MTEEENRLRLADAFWKLAQRVFRGVMTDVVYWVNERGYTRMAFVGNPLKVAQIFGMLDIEGESSPHLAPQIGLAVRDTMGIPLSERDLFEAWQRGSMGLHDMLSRFTGQVAWRWSEAHDAPIGDEGVRVGFIPEPGYPWPAEGDRYWSAKKQRWSVSKRPGWLIDVESPEHPDTTIHGVNPCLVFPADETKTERGGPVCGELDGLSWPIMVTHSMRLIDPRPTGARSHKQLDMAISGIKECGGLLFPSLAVGPIPATNFGPVVLVGHLELVLASLLPYRKGKRRRPSWVYGTDAWTLGTTTMMREMAVELFDEFHGDAEWIHSSIAALGVPATSKQLFGKYVEPLRSTKELASSLRRRMRRWTPDLTLDEFLKKSDADSSDEKYAYAESKAREVVRLDEFPFLVAPEEMGDVIGKFVRGVGYKGKVVLAEAPYFFSDPEIEESRYAHYQWAWQVAEIVQGLRPMVEIQT